MKRMNRPIAMTIAALSLAALAAGCTPEQKATAEQLCREHPSECADLARDMSKVAADQLRTVKAQPLDASVLPDGLRDWAASQQGAEESAAKVIAFDDSIYIGIAGGMQPSGGYTVKLAGDLRREGDGWVAEAQVIPPAPGAMVSMALTNPIAFYRAPKVEGDIQVRFLPPEVSVKPAPTEDGITAKDQVWSPNFRVTKPRTMADGRLFLEGGARAFEGVFRVEVWVGGKLLLTQSVKAAAGAPAFGRFEVALTVPGGVPAGAEVHYLIPSMKDDSATAELTVPVSQ